MRFLPWLVLFVLAACGGGSHPLAGTWQRQSPAAGGSLQLMFDKGSDKVLVCRKLADGSDTDLNGTWKLENGVVRISGVWDDGIAAEWTGSLAGDRLELAIDAQPVVFQRGQ